MANKPADCEAEAPIIKKSDLIRQAVRERVEEVKRTAPRKLRFTNHRTTAVSRSVVRERAVRNEHAENFEMLLHMVEQMADHGSVDCEQVISDFYDEYIASF
jgi:hypothetical protein